MPGFDRLFAIPKSSHTKRILSFDGQSTRENKRHQAKKRDDQSYIDRCMHGIDEISINRSVGTSLASFLRPQSRSKLLSFDVTPMTLPREEEPVEPPSCLTLCSPRKIITVISATSQNPTPYLVA